MQQSWAATWLAAACQSYNRNLLMPVDWMKGGRVLKATTCGVIVALSLMQEDALYPLSDRLINMLSRLSCADFASMLSV